ncbi:hypothetical protein C7212DRAFT_319968 [Tuber magnatum]|uniref:Uncharacterized protein n=1 Tax=Tuber magnatum TaxID=42249 RepID=A0A317SQU5_9PEZI|nr:hypothetical protein C7212DRAFT_319968 [Tuber magnatum]
MGIASRCCFSKLQASPPPPLLLFPSLAPSLFPIPLSRFPLPLCGVSLRIVRSLSSRYLLLLYTGTPVGRE